jgi:hypothetical protein
MKKTIALLFIIFTLSQVFGQANNALNETSNSRRGFSIGYFGDKISNYGYQVGIENYLAATRNYNVIGALFLANYFVPQNFTGLSLNPRIGLRYTTNFGATLESHLGFGYLHRFYRYDVYEVDAQGQVVALKKTSQAAAMPNIAFGLGYDFRRTTKLPVIYYLRTGINYNFPNRHFLFEVSYAIETGIIYVPAAKK